MPENRATTGGRKIKLGVAEIHSANANPAADPIVYLNGGPGSSAIVVANGIIKAGLNQNRTVILVDQRGEYHSDPRLTCPESDAVQALQATMSVLASSTEALEVKTVQTCRNRLAAEGYDLSAYNTPENAADIADLRAAMGIKHWDVYGVSYGSDLALQLLRLFPEGIRSVVLDSVLPPQINFVNHAWKAAAEGFNALFQACAAQAACSQAYPSLSSDLETAVHNLAAHPASVQVPLPDGTSQHLVIDGYTLANVVVVASLSSSFVGLPAMIHDAAQGNVLPTAKNLLTQIAGTPAGLVAYGISYGVFCGEVVPHTNQARELATAQAALPNFPTSVLELIPQAARLLPDCKVWNVRPADPSTAVATKSSVPTLLLNGELDGVTPPSSAKLAAQTLSQSTVVLLPGIGHDTILASPCAIIVLNNFLSKPRDPVDTSCVKSMTVPDLTAPTSAG
ncbi:MAG: alpha/beta hydrolase [Candidatus Dormibacteraceae bacterium]